MKVIPLKLTDGNIAFIDLDKSKKDRFTDRIVYISTFNKLMNKSCLGYTNITDDEVMCYILAGIDLKEQYPYYFELKRMTEREFNKISTQVTVEEMFPEIKEYNKKHNIKDTEKDENIAKILFK